MVLRYDISQYRNNIHIYFSLHPNPNPYHYSLIFGKALRQAWIAATQAFSSIDSSKQGSDIDNALTVDRIVAGVKNIVKSAEVKTALELLSTNLQKSAGDAAKAADIAADQLSTSLNNSEKFRNAVKRLGESFVTLLAILGAASTRMAQEVKEELLGLPNEAKK